MRIATILGARPQFVKAAALSRAFKVVPDIIETIIHTGQHYDENMSDIFFQQMNIPLPDFNLRIATGRHGSMTGRMMEAIEQVLVEVKPDLVLVYGDTNSTLAGALVAKKMHIKVAHVEAGLRSYNEFMPEEINRIITDRISDFLFCPSKNAIDNLKREGFANFKSCCYDVGDIMKDVAYYYRDLSQTPVFRVSDKFILTTLHRAENTDHPDRLLSIVSALDELSSDLQVILPLHPRTRKLLGESDFKSSPNFTIVDPVGYLEMVHLLKTCSLVVTDSGGLQKEAYFFKKRCIVTRDETEWTELVQAGYNIIVGANKELIKSTIVNTLNKSIPFDEKLYGDGKTAERIVGILQNNLLP